MNFVEVRSGSWWQIEHIETIEFGTEDPATPTVVRFFSGVEEWIEPENARRILRASASTAPRGACAVEES